MKPNWQIIVDKRTQLHFSDFFDPKNSMVEPTCEKFQQWNDVGKEVCYLQMDDTGENEKQQQRCESANWKFKIQFEYTPQ
jgi:hypothetical protein